MERVLASVKTGPNKLEIRDFPLPQIDEESALLKMEVAGICGTDVKMFKQPLSGGPVIMGHENIGRIARAGRKFLERKGLAEGDLVFVEHYVPCFKCEWCHRGEYRVKGHAKLCARSAKPRADAWNKHGNSAQRNETWQQICDD